MGAVGIGAIIFDWGRTIYDSENKELFPETKEVLEYCADKYALAIVSLAVDDDIEGRFKMLDEYGIRRYFKSALFHQSDKDSLFRNTVCNLDLPANEVLVVDDRARRMQWAIENGCRTVWLKKGKFENELPDKTTGSPDFIIGSLEQLLKIV